MTLLPGWNVRVGLCGFFFCGLGLALTTGCGDPAPVTAKNSQFQVAGEDDKQPSEKGQAEKGTQPGAAEKSPIKKPAPRTTDDPGEGGPAKTGEPAEVVDDNADYGASEKYPLPPGGPENLMGFLRNLSNKKPKGATKAEQQEDFVAIQDSRLAVARKLMAFPSIPDETKHGLLQLMMEIHQDFLTNKIPGAEERLEAFAKELSDHKDPQVAEIGRAQALDITLNKLASQEPPPADGKEIAAEIEKFVDAAKGSPIAFMAAMQKCIELQRTPGATRTFQMDLVEELKKVAARYKDHPLKQVSSQAEEILKNSGFLEIQIDVNIALKEVVAGKEGAEEKYLAAVKELFEKDKPGELSLQLLSQQAKDLEYYEGKFSTTQKLHDALEARFKDHENKELVSFVTERAEGARKRIGMIGKPMVLEGVTPDGKPFDFAPYQGKYVLVDFWGTWCEPCLKVEMPNIRKNYSAYHAKGFEVVGIALEEKLDRLERFFAFQTLPWQTVISQELFEKKEVEDKMANPIAVASGVESLPFVVLLDKEGKVDSLHLRGPKLEVRLKELLGEPEPIVEEKTEKPAEEKGAKPAAEKPDNKKADDKKPAAEEKPAEKSAKEKKEGGGCGVVLEEEKKDEKAEEVNPYSAKPGLSTDKLVAYIEKMLDKPKTIQSRPGFADAVVEACDRVLSANPAAKESETLAAAEAKFETLHKKACTGDEACDKALTAFTEQMKADTRERIARQVSFFQMERKVIDGAELPVDKIPDLLKELKDFFAAQKLTSKHLRMASSTVALINKLESGDEREKLFGEFGGLFAKASDKELARYGKKLAQKPEAEESDLVGKDLELAGTTAAGNGFKWEGYRGKVVLVDFWATWCGPCKREMPHVKELHEKLAEKGFAVVGISLDKDQEALQAYLAENQIPWENLAGDETQELAEKYGVRGIPTMMAIGKDGKILGVSHNVASLVPIIEKALGK